MRREKGNNVGARDQRRHQKFIVVLEMAKGVLWWLVLARTGARVATAAYATLVPRTCQVGMLK